MKRVTVVFAGGRGEHQEWAKAQTQKRSESGDVGEAAEDPCACTFSEVLIHLLHMSTSYSNSLLILTTLNFTLSFVFRNLFTHPAVPKICKFAAHSQILRETDRRLRGHGLSDLDREPVHEPRSAPAGLPVHTKPAVFCHHHRSNGGKTTSAPAPAEALRMVISPRSLTPYGLNWSVTFQPIDLVRTLVDYMQRNNMIMCVCCVCKKMFCICVTNCVHPCMLRVRTRERERVSG